MQTTHVYETLTQLMLLVVSTETNKVFWSDIHKTVKRKLNEISCSFEYIFANYFP